MAIGSAAGHVAPVRRSRVFAALGRLGRGDRLALALLVLIPFALYLPSLITGGVVAPGDDLTQNLPLRELAGEMIRMGHLPAWDPLIWSGTPLLAVEECGALYPGTFLFAFLPLSLAWTLNLISVPLCAGAGMHLLLRQHRVGPLAALIGALLFTYTGFMSGQMVHLGLVQGTALLPFALLAIHGLARASTRAARIGNIALLGSALGLTVLAGDPRAISSTVIAAAIYVLGYALFLGTKRLRLLGELAAASLLGAALSAAQWLPGLTFLSNSQRSSAAYSFFASGSIGPTRLASQLLVPFIFGSNGNFGVPVYGGDYNLPEVTIGCGLVALIAALVYLFPLLRRISARLLKSQPMDDDRHLGMLYALTIVGLLLTMGSNTPLGHLLVHIPFFGSERLQNRNAVLFDLPLSFLVAYLVQDIGDAESEVRQLLQSWRAIVVALPPLGAVALSIYAWMRPDSVATRFRIPSLAAVLVALRPYFAATIVLAVAVAAALLLAPLQRARTARLLAAVAVLCEVGLYVAFASYAEVPISTLASSTPVSAALSAQIGATGRFALYNPDFQTPAGGQTITNELGMTDLNILQGHASVEGYGSIVSGGYQNQTGTHLLGYLSASAINSITADALNLRTLATLPVYFDVPIAADAPIPLVISPGHATGVTPGSGLPPYFAGPWPLDNETPATFVLPSPRPLTRVTIEFDPGTPTPKTITVRTTGPAGAAVQHTVRVSKRVARVDLGLVSADAIEISDANSERATIGAVVAVVANPAQRLLLAGPMQGALAPPHWKYAGQVNSFVLWNNTRASGLAWLEPPASTVANPAIGFPGTVRVLTNSLGAPERAQVATRSTSELVRSEAYSGGWTARLQPVGGGPIKVLAVRPLGLVQAVTLPKGNWIVTFRYAPASLLLGLVGSIAGLVVLLVLLVCLGRRRTGY